eukprot:GDKI01038568.1.p2 GENE.GDKI01038568.1~~GDKI01038568.1.p2  ORF type:complete len:302 (-),score=95.70 GDKI01038568.1:66-938(-)
MSLMDMFFGCCAEEKLTLLKGDPHFPLHSDATEEAKQLFEERTDCVDMKKGLPSGSVFVFPVVTMPNGEKGVVCGSVDGGRQHHRLSPIGGKVESEETYGAGLLRELSEEVYGLVSGTLQYGGKGKSPLVDVKNAATGEKGKMPEVAFIGEGTLHPELLHHAQNKVDGFTLQTNSYMNEQHSAYRDLEFKLVARQQGKSSVEDFTPKEKEEIENRLREKAMAELVIIKLEGFVDAVLEWDAANQKDVELSAYNTQTGAFENRQFLNARVGLFNDLMLAKGVQDGLRAMGA